MTSVMPDLMPDMTLDGPQKASVSAGNMFGLVTDLFAAPHKAAGFCAGNTAYTATTTKIGKADMIFASTVTAQDNTVKNGLQYCHGYLLSRTAQQMPCRGQIPEKQRFYLGLCGVSCEMQQRYIAGCGGIASCKMSNTNIGGAHNARYYFH